MAHALKLAILLSLPVLASFSEMTKPNERVELKVSGPPIEATATRQQFIYATPEMHGGDEDSGVTAQNWSILGREDLGASSGSPEYDPAACSLTREKVSGWNEIIDKITAEAADHRVVIVNESHAVTRHRQTARRLLTRLRPLGFTVFAAEAFTNLADGQTPIDYHAKLAWPHQFDGFYTNEPIFGRLVRHAKKLNYRLAAYEQILSSDSKGDDSSGIQQREDAQVRNLVRILKSMGPSERLFVYVGYSHANEVPKPDSAGQSLEWMAAGLKRITGIDPLTISQTLCRSEEGEPFLANLPRQVAAGSFDMVISYPVETFVNHRPAWRKTSGDISVEIPTSLRPVNGPLVIEAFAWNEPFASVPIDRVFVRPREKIPLLLPPGRYRVRAVRPPTEPKSNPSVAE